MKKLGGLLFVAACGATLVPLISLAGGLFYVDSTTGFIGIGNTNPASSLDVSGAMHSRLVTASSTSINWNTGNVQSFSLTSNSTLTFSNGQAGGKYDLILIQDSTGGRTVTFPASVKWTGGATPSLSTDANSTSIVSFLSDGTNYFASVSYRPAAPPIAFDAEAQGSGNPTFSWTHTPAGTPTLAIVSGYENAQDITSVTYGGQTMTLAATPQQTGTGGVYLVLYYLVNPPSGAQTVTVNKPTDGAYAYLSSMTYTGTAITSAAIGNVATYFTGSAASSYNFNLTAVAATSWVVGVGAGSVANATGIAGGGAAFSFRGSQSVLAHDSNGAVTSGSDTITYTYAASQTAGMGAIELEIRP